MEYKGIIFCLWMILFSWLAFVMPHDSLADHSQKLPPPVAGLAYGFYNNSCPNAESIVKQTIQSFLSQNVSQAAGIVRLFFHDCFVQGCDGSILINHTNGEQKSIPNLTLRQSALSVIDQIKNSVESACPNTVSCADILALAAREAVNQAGGPFFPIPTGRRDSLNFSNNATVLANIPAPTFNSSQLLSSFSSKGLNATDLVALSGAHTIGLAHCSSFSDRLRPTVDPRLKRSFAKKLLRKCPNSSVNPTIQMDTITPNVFDRQYYKNIKHGRVLFDSDATLLTDARTNSSVEQFSSSKHIFFTQFPISFIKMSMIQVLTINSGNIRKVCSILNSSNLTAHKTDREYSKTNVDLASNEGFSAII